MPVDNDISVPAPSASSGEVGKLISEFNLISYRLEAIEKRLDSSLELLAKKLDELIHRHNETKERQALTSQALESVNDEVDKLEKRLVSLEKDVVIVQISMAERIAYGGLGGGFVAGAIELIKFLMVGA
jgi:methyl-accepting chemotaxis protein